MAEQPARRRFTVEDWRHYGRLKAGGQPVHIFFLFQLSGDPGRFPAAAQLVGPDGNEHQICDDQVEFSPAGSAFLEVDCTLQRPVPGQYLLQLSVADDPPEAFPFHLAAP